MPGQGFGCVRHEPRDDNGHWQPKPWAGLDEQPQPPSQPQSGGFLADTPGSDRSVFALRDGLQHGFDSGRRRRREESTVQSFRCRSITPWACPATPPHPGWAAPTPPSPLCSPCRQFPPCPTNSTIRTITTITTSVSLGTWAAASPSCGTRGLYQPWTTSTTPTTKTWAGWGRACPLWATAWAPSTTRSRRSTTTARTATIRCWAPTSTRTLPCWPEVTTPLQRPRWPRSGHDPAAPQRTARVIRATLIHGPRVGFQPDRPLSSSSSSWAPGSGSGQLEEITPRKWRSASRPSSSATASRRPSSRSGCCVARRARSPTCCGTPNPGVNSSPAAKRFAACGSGYKSPSFRGCRPFGLQVRQGICFWTSPVVICRLWREYLLCSTFLWCAALWFDFNRQEWNNVSLRFRLEFPRSLFTFEMLQVHALEEPLRSLFSLSFSLSMKSF